MNNVEEKYCKIIESGNSEQMIAFLKRLDEKTRRALVPLIKKDVKRLCAYGGHNGIYRQVGTQNQFEMLVAAIISCYSRKDCKNIDVRLFWGTTTVSKVLIWYCPEWFTDYINDFSLKGSCPLTYEQMSSFLAAGYLSAAEPALIARGIVQSLDFISLEKYHFTFSEHIWTIFNYPCDVSYCDQFFPSETKPLDAGERKWIYIFDKFIKNKCIDKVKVLKESLLAVNRNFDKFQTNWYAILFSALEPTVEECIQLQDELFAAFNCPQSKPVNTALQAIKKIIDHPAFRADEFISYLPLLFSSVTKGIVSSSLTLADKLAKQTPAKRPEICQHLTGVFLSKDASLQNNAAKLLVKYGDPTDPALSALLMSYTDNLLFDARERLTDFLDVKPATADIEEEVTEVLPLIREDNRIPEIECWDDFVFLAGRAFLNLESYHFDQLPAALLRFAHEINEDNVAQLEPAFAQAWKMINPASSFDAMLASFFMEYAGVLLERFPLQTHKIQPLYEKYQAIKNSNKKYEQIDWGFYPF